MIAYTLLIEVILFEAKTKLLSFDKHAMQIDSIELIPLPSRFKKIKFSWPKKFNWPFVDILLKAKFRLARRCRPLNLNRVCQLIVFELKSRVSKSRITGVPLKVTVEIDEIWFELKS